MLIYKQIEQSVNDKLDNFFKLKNGFVNVNPGNVIMPRKFSEIGDEVLRCSIRETDVWLLSYPRTGSTWAQEMIWLLGHNFDYEGAKHLQQLRTPLLELTAIIYEDHQEWLNNSVGNSVQLINNLVSPRYVKSHLPWQLLPKELDIVKPKIIYIARNPKDLCVSYFHYCKLVHNLIGSFEEFCEIFLDDNAPIGAMWSHMLAMWHRRDQPNILFLKYEDMKKDLPSTIYKCAKFLGVDKQLCESDITRLCEHLNFENMQKNPACNLEPIIFADDSKKSKLSTEKFIRKGQIGDWKNFMSKEMSERFDRWIECHTKGTGLQFDYE